MAHRGLVCLLFGSLAFGLFAWGQAEKSAPPAAAAQKPATETPAAKAAKPADADAEEAAPQEAPADAAKDVPLDAAVITIPGVCDNAPADKADCKTVITRKEFESLIDAVAPKIPPFQRRQLATRYATALATSKEAEKLGLDKSPRYDIMMKVSRIQVLSQEYNRALQDKAGQVPDKDVEDYYNKNKAQFEEADMDRLFIPKGKSAPTSKVKLTAAQEKAREDAGLAAMKAEASRLRARAAAGEDFAKLQGEAFQFANIKVDSPKASMGKVRKAALPPAHSSAFDLKVGDISQVITDTSGYFVYKMKGKDTVSLEDAKPEIHNVLRSERMQKSMEQMQQAAAPQLDDKYFGPAPPPQATPGKPMMPPQPPGKAPGAAPKPPDAAQPKK